MTTLTNTTRWTGTSDGTTPETHTAPSGSAVGTDYHPFDFIIHQAGNAEVVSDYVTASANTSNNQISSTEVLHAINALLGQLRHSESLGTNFSKINRVVVTVDMET